MTATSTTTSTATKPVYSPDKHWIVHGKFYDLSSFKHPGGQDWIQLTKGQDCSIAFEIHHMDQYKTLSVLAKYYVGDIQPDQPEYFLMKPKVNGFYQTLRKSFREHLAKNPNKYVFRMWALPIALVLAWAVVLTFIARSESTPWALIVIGGFLLDWIAGFGHNYLHQRDTILRFTMDLSVHTSFDWRGSHALSHHLYTNHTDDVSLDEFWPFFQFRVDRPGGWIQTKALFMLHHAAYIIAAPVIMINRISQSYRTKNYSWLFHVAVIFYVFAINGSLWTAFLYWALMHTFSVYYFLMIGLLNHNGPQNFPDWKQVKDLDHWAAYQLQSTRDYGRSWPHCVSMMVMFLNKHSLHHLFPHIDCTWFHELYPILDRVCRQFDIPPPPSHSLKDMISGFYVTLIRDWQHPPVQKKI